MAGSLLAAGAVALTLAARRQGTSQRAWLVANVAAPLVTRSGDPIAAMYRRIAADRARGPAPVPAAIRSRHAYGDTTLGGLRALRLAPRGGGAPAGHILYLHGGAYVFDLMPMQWRIVAGIVARTGAETVTPIYPLAPEARVDDALDAVEAVYRALAAEVGGRGIVVMGDSAGGGLALALAHRLRDTDGPHPAALLLFFPWLDVSLSGPDQPALAAVDPALTLPMLREAGALWAGDASPALPPASPLFADQGGLPPTFVLTGTRDLLLSDARRFAARSPAATVREYPGMIHGWVAIPLPEAARALDEAAAFAMRHLGNRR